MMNRERKVVIALFGGTLFLLVLLWGFLVHPALRKRESLRTELTALDAAVQAFRERDGASAYAAVRGENLRLRREWRRMRDRTMTFRDGSPLGEELPSTEQGRINFKVALIDAREQLVARAREAGTRLPERLGIEETIGEEEDPETRLWQLASMVQLVDNCMHVGVPEITSVSTMPPLTVHDGDAGHAALYEYPTQARMNGTFETAVRFLESLRRHGRFFALRGFQFEIPQRAAESSLQILAVCSALPPPRESWAPRNDEPPSPAGGRRGPRRRTAPAPPARGVPGEAP